MIAFSTWARLEIASWARSNCGAFKVLSQDFRALGIEIDGKLSAAIFYDDFRRNDCNISVYIENRRAVTRRTLGQAFAYPFVDLDLGRVSVAVKATNVRSWDLIKRLGFKLEGVRRRIYEDGTDEILYGMLREECRWLAPRDKLFDPHTGGAY